MDLGSVFSDIKALKSFSYLISSLTEAPETFDERSLLLTSSASWP
jgi:phage-related protein